MKALPKTVYVYWEQDGAFLMAYANVKDAANTDKFGEARLAGVYELKEEVTVTTEVKTTIVPKRTRRSK